MAYRGIEIALCARGRIDVKTIYDLVTMAIFAGLVVLFLQRSVVAPEACAEESRKFNPFLRPGPMPPMPKRLGA